MAKRKHSTGRPLVLELTEPQRRTLEVLQKLIARNKVPPTVKELAAARDVAIGTIQDQLAQLIRKGYVQRDPHKARNLSILRSPAEEVGEVVEIPILGTVAAGSPIWAEQNVLGYITVESAIARGLCFGLKVTGDSMIRANILAGDVVIVRQQPIAENGDIVVAMIDRDSATVKRLSITDDVIQLLPENPKYRPITIQPDQDLRIVGKVIGIRRVTVQTHSL